MNIKNFMIGIVIIILTLFVVMYGINTLYPKPKYNNYCEDSIKYKNINNKEDCLIKNGSWIPYDTPDKNNSQKLIGYCDINPSCISNYETANKNYYKNIFLITLPVGILIILIGMFLFKLEPVGSGLMGGGIISIIYGVGGYWRYSENILKFLFSLIGLIIIIWAAYKFNKKNKKK